MIRSVPAVAIVTAIAIGVSAAMAQQDPIKARKDLMKANGDQAKIGAAMVKGDRPFDLAAVHKIFATFEDAAVKMPALSAGRDHHLLAGSHGPMLDAPRLSPT